ncbi:rhodanese-like domain-containing protein [Wenxinia saemankumensis]|uniref:Rhodanese-related sulfurtransferase n=1 Tax=Wenxinia saemankumensis TaxID=1447782 RepID=A0A1M6C6S7_9RHOB|nr:rhodanese-like domain-containing protein [Wenxinia saemankumensis]SHI56501.1 Rhodanese-related sulfurtransferase [Wenxinia saemankumensis]
MKTAQDFLDKANAVVPRIGFDDAVAKHKSGNTLFVDVRDSGDIARTGTIEGAKRIPRGMIEFVADPNTPFHDPALTPDADIVLICGKGGQAALSGKTLHDMGFKHLANAGGFPDWKEKGGPSEAG